MKRSVWSVVLICLFAVVSMAADVSGKWKAEFTSPDGTQRVNNFTFKVDGEKLTGSVAGSQDETPIQDGSIKGDAISFKAERPFGTFTYKGTVKGNEIVFSVQFNDNSFNITAKRVQ